MSEDPTEERIRGDVNKFLLEQVELSELSMKASVELLRLVLLVEECKQGELNEEA